MANLNPGVTAAVISARNAYDEPPSGEPTYSLGYKMMDGLSGSLDSLRTAIVSLTNVIGTSNKSSISGAGGSTRPSTVTVGSVSAVVATGAAADVAASWAGKISSAYKSTIPTGMSTDLIARSANLMWGKPQTNRQALLTVGNFSQLKNLSGADFVQGLANLQANPIAWANQRNMMGSISVANMLQRSMPSLGAAGSSAMVSGMLSNQFMSAAMSYGGPSAWGGIYDPMTGKIKSGPQALKSMLTVATGGSAATWTAKQAQGWANSPFGMSTMQKNLAKEGIDPTQGLTILKQYMAAGMNYNKAFPKGSTAFAALTKSTAQTAAGNTVYEQTVDLQRAIYNAETQLFNFAKSVAAVNATLTSVVVGGALASGVGLKGAGMLAEGSLLARGLGGLGGAGGVAGLAGTALKGGALAVGGGLLGSYVGRKASDLISGGQRHGARHRAGHAVADALTGAGIGAGIGTVIPGVGTVVGGAVGAGIGGLVGLFSGDPVNLPGPGSTRGMSAPLSGSLRSMFAANPRLELNSGTRTHNQQAALYTAKGGVGVARPGHSAHESGHAADIGPPSQFAWLAKNASKFGLKGSSEPWHFEAMGDASGSDITGYANTFVGVSPYVSGGGWSSVATPGQGVDCSGFVRSVYAHFGVTLPNGSIAQSKKGTAINGLSNAQPGDLLFFNTGDGPQPGHVGIYMGNGKMVDAAHSGTDVRIESVWGGLMSIRRVLNAVQGQQAAKTIAKGGGTGGNIVGLGNNFISQVAALGAGSALGASGGGGVGMWTGGSTTAGSAVSGGGGGATLSGGTVSSNQALGRKMAAAYGWGTGTEWADLNNIVMAESGWNVTATNPTSGAYGIPQSYPADKMASAGPDWKTNPATQIKWMLGYIKGRYGDPIKAWAFHQANNSYEKGSWQIPSDQVAIVHRDEMVVPAAPARRLRQAAKSGGLGGGKMNVTQNIQLVSVSRQEAQRLAHMALDCFQEESGYTRLGAR